MKKFSVTEAIAEPFRQAGRRPMATIIWGLVLLAPTAMAFSAIIPLMLDLAASGALDRGPGADVAWGDEHFEAMMQFQIWSHLANIVQLFTVLLVTTAIFRAVFRGRGGDRAAFLRIGMHELYVAVMGVTIVVGVIIAVVVAALLAVAIGLALSGTPEPWRTLINVGMAVTLGVGFLALWGRLALLAPASLRYDTFAFVEGWKLGRGQTWRLAALLILMFLVAVVICIGFVILIAIVAMLVGGGLAAANPEAMLAWLEGLPEQPALLVGLGLLFLLPMAWIQGFCQLLATAPFARVALDLAPDAEPGPAISADTAPIGH